MKLNIYDKDLNRLRFIDQNFISCLWKEKYNSSGDFTLEIAATDITKNIIKPDYYVGRADRKTLMVIKSVVVNGDIIVATGKTADRQLKDVAFIGTISANSNVPNAIKTAYNSSNQYHKFVIADSDLTAIYPQQISHKSIGELLETMCSGTDTGYKAVKVDKTIEIQFYQPAENENLKFAKQYGNIVDIATTLSTEPYKNYAIVLGQGEGENRVRVDVDIRTDSTEQRRDLIVDAKDLQQDSEETAESYNARLSARGFEKLLENIELTEVNFTPVINDFGSKYDVGSIITVLINDFGLKIKSRITSFKEKEQKNKTELTVEVSNIAILSNIAVISDL